MIRDKSLLNTVCVLSRFSHVQLFVTLWTITHHAPLSTEFSREEYWSGLPCLSPMDLPNPGIQSASLMSPALAGRFFTTNATWEAKIILFSVNSSPKMPGLQGQVKYCLFEN